MKNDSRGGKLGELMAKGFSKTKCTQALKDAGNNATLALRLLERQKQQNELSHAPPRSADAKLVASNGQATSGGAASSPLTCSAAASIPSLHRARSGGAGALPLTDAQKKLQRQRERRHPCVVQYGSCQYGDFCLLKDFPGDVCVQHFQGCCIYGSSCRHRHCVDGVDVREVLREAQAAEAAALQLFYKDGATYRVEEGDGDTKVQVATLVERNAVDDPSHYPTTAPEDATVRRTSGPGFPSPLANAHWHADPSQRGGTTVVATADDDGDGEEGRDEDFGDDDSGGPLAAAQHPTPFLDRARAGAAPAAARASSAGVVGGGGGGAARPPRRRHPCIAQYGSCKYGDACLHADRDADVCVHYLHGRCRFSAADCKYRHESAAEYQRALRLRAGLDDDAAEPRRTSSSTTAAAAHVTRPKKRLQGIGGMGMGGDGGSNSLSNGGGGRGEEQAGAKQVSAATTASPLPSFDDLNALSATPSSETSSPPDPHISDAETRVFLWLVEAYPAVEPAVVLQTLRLCGGDPVKASDMIGQFGSALMSLTEGDDIAAALALAAADEAAERETATAAAHNSLLTLVMLFPSVEVAAVEAVLTQQKNDFAAAYNVLLCAQEKMVRAALWRGSSAALSPADQLRVEKLYRMFPGLHSDIVRSAFCATGHDWSGTTTALNELTKELLSLEAVEAPTGPVVWRPPTAKGERCGDGDAPVRAASSAAPPFAPSVGETSADAYEAYRAAEKDILSYGDWRQVRQQAYLLNSQRIRVLGQASAAFHQGDGRTAKLLSREGHRMTVEYNRLNRMAMLALEQERLRTDATSTLDLHGFHTAEVHDIVVRRVEVCQRKRVGRLRLVVGEGLHSKRGRTTLYPVLMEELRTDAYLKSATKVKSVKPGYVDVAVLLPAKDS
ncbi:hypothetical protein ABB37_09602 [Leptomonas pyrrhocoris]|uniref:Uncharacterized protein n=1 Tax=Leptomonas pyrrhocoris TaxID=157538 RepID=A0A0M9FQ24_LEPPY|nr:hypothetical protein ABB37_09602 [Leptomonas pyrrhocoris]KPA73663.1 hypothetical protein ABB37_09602 [Leptomonas pyrrhocoris]|eukprot:XP_015652102.1 hypothetical protein ABB37_09602 [Leptomonas pyrrhocoris]